MVQTSRSGETKASQNPSFPAIDVQRGHSYGASNNNNNNGPVDRRTSRFKDYPSERNSLKAKRRRRRQSTASSGSSSGSGDSDDSSLPEAPNGGWGWAVVVASFIVHLIADGCSFSFGVIYAELLDYFDESKSKTAWVGSLFISIPMLAGPIASAATNRYGCRVTTIVGGFLAGLGFVLSFFAPNIEVLCVTFGLISGFGLALVYVPAVVIVAYYFEERRAFATGVAVAGSGIGTFLFAPLTDLLIETYGGWRGAVLVLGGVMMNISVCGMIFRSLEDNNDSDSESGDSSSDDETTSSGKAAHRSHTGQSLEAFSRWSSYAARINEPNARHDEDRHRHVSGRSNGGEAGDCVTFQLDPEVEQMLEEPVSQSLVLFPTYLQGEINVMSGDVIKELKESGKTLRDILTDHNLLQLLYERHTLDELMASVAESLNKSHEAVNLDLGPEEEEECLDSDPGTTFGRPVTMSECEDPSTSVARRSNLTQGGRRLVQRKRRNTHRQHVRMRVIHPLNRKDIFYRGNVRKDIFYRHNLRSVFNVRPPMARAASCPDVIVHVAASDVSEEGRCGLLQLSHEVKQIMSEMLDISILKTFSFLYFCASCMLLYSAYDVPYVYAPDTVSEMFSTKLASYVLSVIGIASTIGQILIGYIGDLPEVNTMHLYNFCVSMAGLCTCFVPLLTQYWMFCVYGALYGLFISANYSLTTIIIVNLFGMSKLTNAYGIINMAQGAANLVGPPLAGYIADVTDSYDLAFYLAGITMIVSGLMLFAVPCIKKYDPKSRLASRVTSAHELQSVASRRGSAPVVSGASAVPNAVAIVTDGKVTDQAPPSPSPSR